MRVALVSLNQIWNDKPGNLKRCRHFIERAKINGCQLVVFPEMTLTGYSLDICATAEPADQSNTMSAFSDMANEFRLNIVFGSCLKNVNEDRAQNMLCLASPKKSPAAVYAKIHPFTFVGEEKKIASGKQLGFIEFSGVRFGASICYDLRFPMVYSLMAPQCTGAICIANWPKSRLFHWQTLLVARAIENQMFLIGVNRIGEDATGLVYEKSSMLVAPDGGIVEPLISDEEFDVYEMDVSATERYRAEFPTLRDSRFHEHFHHTIN